MDNLIGKKAYKKYGFFSHLIGVIERNTNEAFPNIPYRLRYKDGTTSSFTKREHIVLVDDGEINEESENMLDQLTEKIKGWAIERNLHTADPNKQILKLIEEVGELSSAMARSDEWKTADAIGDIYVVLTILSMQLGLNIESCVDAAYDEIKDRKGKMVNGVFVKESDL